MPGTRHDGVRRRLSRLSPRVREVRGDDEGWVERRLRGLRRGVPPVRRGVREAPGPRPLRPVRGGLSQVRGILRDDGDGLRDQSQRSCGEAFGRSSLSSAHPVGSGVETRPRLERDPNHVAEPSSCRPLSLDRSYGETPRFASGPGSPIGQSENPGVGVPRLLAGDFESVGARSRIHPRGRVERTAAGDHSPVRLRDHNAELAIAADQGPNGLERKAAWASLVTLGRTISAGLG